MDPLFGIEETDKFGVLTHDCQRMAKSIEKIESTKSSYIKFV